MALSDKQRQKKLQRKKKKRQSVKSPISKNRMAEDKAVQYANYPIHECIVPNGLFETGVGTASVSRRLSADKIALAGFVLDVFCLGVKNALFRVVSDSEYEYYKSNLLDSHEGQSLEIIHPTSARKLIEGAVAYADNLGFKPHRDYKNAKELFGKIDSQASPVKYDFGKDAKPFYMQGPHETDEQARNIMNKLHRKCGEGNYHFLMEVGENSFE